MEEQGQGVMLGSVEIRPLVVVVVVVLMVVL